MLCVSTKEKIYKIDISLLQFEEEFEVRDIRTFDNFNNEYEYNNIIIYGNYCVNYNKRQFIIKNLNGEIVFESHEFSDYIYDIKIKNNKIFIFTYIHLSSSTSIRPINKCYIYNIFNFEKLDEFTMYNNTGDYLAVFNGYFSFLQVNNNGTKILINDYTDIHIFNIENKITNSIPKRQLLKNNSNYFHIYWSYDDNYIFINSYNETILYDVNEFKIDNKFEVNYHIYDIFNNENYVVILCIINNCYYINIYKQYTFEFLNRVKMCFLFNNNFFILSEHTNYLFYVTIEEDDIILGYYNIDNNKFSYISLTEDFDYYDFNNSQLFYGENSPVLW